MATAGCRARSSGSSAIAARCAAMVDELFDETKRDSAIGRIEPDARVLLRRRRLEARPPARPDAAELPDAPVPPGDLGRVQGRRGAARRDRGGRRRPWRRARRVRGEGRRLRGPARGDAGRPGPRRRRPAGSDRARGRGRHEVQEGRLRPDGRRAGGARVRPARRHRGEGPADVDAGDPRGAARGPREPRCRGRAWWCSRRPTPRPVSRRSPWSATTSTA